jgi:hypothetical protein
MVTGGTGLVGSALQRVSKTRSAHEQWIFLGHKDADLLYDVASPPPRVDARSVHSF